MNRRDTVLVLIALGVAPLAAQAQQTGTVYRIGFLGGGLPSTSKASVEGLREGLRELGYVEGRNFIFDFRWGEGRNDRLAELAAELVRANVHVIVTAGEPAIRAAKQATTSLPIVMGAVGDPVGAGFAASLARPSGNITGVSNLAVEMTGKWLELLREAVPRISRVAVLWNPANPTHHAFWKEAQAAGRTMGVKVSGIEFTGPDDFDRGFTTMAVERVDGVLVLPDPVTGSNRVKLAELMAKRRLPGIALFRESAEAGFLLSYGVSTFNNHRRAAVYVDRILKGAKPANLPIEQGTKFELVINLKTAKALGLTIPQSLLVRADEVIQ
jgi:putative tryptophan/tyrosine transport system substrate-binding protein